MKKLSLYLFVFSLFIYKGNAQSADKEAIETVINTLFKGMHDCDSAMVRSVFHPKAALNSIGFSEKSQQNYFTSDNRIKSFLEAIAKPKTVLWNEVATSFEIKIDKQMAQAWVPYTFHLGEKFSHCGVDNFVLFKEDFSLKSSLNNSNSNTKKSSDEAKSWKIIYLVDTMRKDNCVK
jgi:hypothetical protein